MDTKKISVIAVFAALTIALNLSPVKVPAPYAPFLIYQIWEVPIVAVMLLYGFTVGTVISVINTLALLAVFPGALPAGPLYNLAAVLSTLIGVYFIDKLLSGGRRIGKDMILLTLMTVLGITSRVVVMTLVNWVFLPYPPPVGFSIPAQAVVAILPLIAFFNATLALYTIPFSYALAKAIRARMAPSHTAFD